MKQRIVKFATKKKKKRGEGMERINLFICWEGENLV